MRGKFSIAITLNLAIFIIVSVVAFIMIRNISFQVLLSYGFFILGGLCTSYFVYNFIGKHIRNVAVNIVNIFMVYLYWTFTGVILFLVGVVPIFPYRLFLVLELLPLGVLVLIYIIFNNVEHKLKKDDYDLKTRDLEISDIYSKISSMEKKISNLSPDFKKEILKRLDNLKEEIRYSEMLSKDYKDHMIQDILKCLEYINLEIDYIVENGFEDTTNLDNIISNFVTTIKNNNEICKISKR